MKFPDDLADTRKPGTVAFFYSGENVFPSWGGEEMRDHWNDAFKKALDDQVGRWKRLEKVDPLSGLPPA